MKTKKEWLERARELYDALRVGEDIWIAMLQLGREMSDERAEEIARLCREGQPALFGENTKAAGRYEAAAIARSTIQKPKTREQVLEEALREIASKPFDPFSPERAKAALEWKP